MPFLEAESGGPRSNATLTGAPAGPTEMKDPARSPPPRVHTPDANNPSERKNLRDFPNTITGDDQ